MILNRLFYIPLAFTLIYCTPKAQEKVSSGTLGDLHTVFKLPKKLKEASGIQLSPDGLEFYIHEDQGNSNEIFVLDMGGNLARKVTVEGVENTDWEDITQDKQGFTYIGDFGNNDNDRKDLAIYKMKIGKESSVPVLQTTKFSYPEQTEFPPKKKNFLYDCEAFIEHNGHFYLFTKNRSKGFDGTSLVYKIPNKPGTFKAQLIGKIKLPGKFDDAAVTGADISPDGKKIALITHKNVFLLENFQQDNFTKATVNRIDLQNNSQKEGICFAGNKRLFITEERTSKEDGKIYFIDLK
ncbi:hypothetical protein [Elizabethkingia meningoseptica]|uniref:hypothetical protein n=1 Tax=Elizabethkingia meningoseptica TaxID=238 RepID=UPI0020128471|nr:hypothetical protein [Elizabethkingia meningoseptica]MCL1674177.1 hypothetical protein [Elizabethkingia meningoseptica]MCL1685182.1 hypothetical protein [Elizabethkingia meningoseptica]MDE5432340.1 hypothetical protein [Elizabethkingia meningoseptica]